MHADDLSWTLEQLDERERQLIQIRDSDYPYQNRALAVIELIGVRAQKSELKNQTNGKPIEERKAAEATGRKRRTKNQTGKI